MSKEKPQTNESEDLTIAMTQFYAKRKVNNRAIKLTEKVCLGFLHTSFFPGTACVKTTVITGVISHFRGFANFLYNSLCIS